jgi:hypothetical protein
VISTIALLKQMTSRGGLMPKPIRLTQEEYNRLCCIEHHASTIYNFIENDLKPDWPALRDKDQRFSYALYCHIRLKELLSKEN